MSFALDSPECLHTCRMEAAEDDIPGVSAYFQIIFVFDGISQVVMITLPRVHPLCPLVFPLVCIVRSLNVIK